jgi:exonuclease VII small subunit
MANEKTMKFYDAYQELEKIAEEMQDDPEKVIDVMEIKLKRAIELNKFCSERLNKVQEMLDKYKADSSLNGTNGSSMMSENNIVSKKANGIGEEEGNAHF